MLVMPNAHTTMVHQTYADDHRLHTTIAVTKGHPDPPQPGRILPSTVAATSSAGMQAIRTIIQKQGISTEAADIILKSSLLQGSTKVMEYRKNRFSQTLPE